MRCVQEKTCGVADIGHADALKMPDLIIPHLTMTDQTRNGGICET